MFVKTRLLTPGPTATAESTRLAMAAALPHHRSSVFTPVFLRSLELLRWFWETDDDVLFVSGSGTAGMEAALRTVLRAGDEVVVVTGGKFADRWHTIVKLLGCRVHLVEVPWGSSATVAQLDEVLAAAGDVRALVCVASETSTGALHPVVELVEALRARFPEAVAMVDGITAVGTVDLSMRRHGIDVLVSGTQKAFGLPPGGAMVGMSARAWSAADRDGCTAYYLDLRRERKQTAQGQSACTPAHGLIVGLHEVFERWHAAGRERVLEHARVLSDATVAGVRALGLELFPSGPPSRALTAVAMPDGVRASELVAWMRSRCGLTCASGQDHLKDVVLRIGHLGAVDPFDIVQGIAALELALQAAGRTTEAGAGVAAVQRVIAPALVAQAPLLYQP